MSTKRIVFVQLGILVLFISFGFSAQADTTANNTAAGKSVIVVQDGLYHPEIQYKGDYITTALYYRHTKRQPWMRMSKSDNYLDSVVCFSALAKLGTDGRWQGNLNNNGSCGTVAEPAWFVLGNRLNYEESIIAQ
jgi:hypothetical protein